MPQLVGSGHPAYQAFPPVPRAPLSEASRLALAQLRLLLAMCSCLLLGLAGQAPRSLPCRVSSRVLTLTGVGLAHRLILHRLLVRMATPGSCCFSTLASCLSLPGLFPAAVRLGGGELRCHYTVFSRLCPQRALAGGCTWGWGRLEGRSSAGGALKTHSLEGPRISPWLHGPCHCVGEG